VRGITTERDDNSNFLTIRWKGRGKSTSLSRARGYDKKGEKPDSGALHLNHHAFSRMSCYKFETKLFFDEDFAGIRSRLSELLDIATLNELGSKKISHPEPASIQLLVFMRHFQFSFSPDPDSRSSFQKSKTSRDRKALSSTPGPISRVSIGPAQHCGVLWLSSGTMATAAGTTATTCSDWQGASQLHTAMTQLSLIGTQHVFLVHVLDVDMHGMEKTLPPHAPPDSWR
jgi:hypothetical protein